MIFTLVFSITFLIGVLTSQLAKRSILSTAVMFLAAGFVAANGQFGTLAFTPENPLVVWLSVFALFSVLFLPITFVGTAALRTRSLACRGWSRGCWAPY